MKCSNILMKVKIGVDLIQDLEQLTMLPESFGSSIIIRTDVNLWYTIAQFKKKYQDCANLDIDINKNHGL